MPVVEYTPSLLAHVARIERVLDRLLPDEDRPPRQLRAAMRYSVLGGGKRLRPALAYATCHAFGGAPALADASAAAVEIIHAYSLIHDDLPAMDDDLLRRGKPTCHVAFGEATAILAGDALQAMAFEVLAADTAPSPGARATMVRRLAEACGADGMAGGQALDLAAVGKRLDRDELERMHACKTGALIRASVALGALAGGVELDALLLALDRYASALGMAFQVRDDILDIEGDTSVIGKQQGADALRDKPTFPSILGLEPSRDYAETKRAEMLAALAEVSVLVPDAQLDDLMDLAHYAIDRRS